MGRFTPFCSAFDPWDIPKWVKYSNMLKIDASIKFLMLIITRTSRIPGRETPVSREKLSGADHFNLIYFQIELIF